MDVQDHKTISSSEHEIHSVHLCNKCGWPFPNPHPSAKHRRAHKRVCGTIEGYRLIDSGSDHANLAGSDNEHHSDDERRSPSPNVKESDSSGGMGLKLNRSEDELFSDAATDFSDNGVGPSLGEGLGSVKKLDKNVGGEFSHVLEDSDVSKDEKTADKSQPLHGLIQLLQGSVKASEIVDSDVIRSESNQSEITKLTGDKKSENVSAEISSTCLEFSSSQVISEVIVVSGDSTTDSETGKQNDLISSGVETDIVEKEKGDKAVDIHSSSASEVLQSEHKLETEPKLEDIVGEASEPVAQEARSLETDKETLDPHVESDFQYKLNNVNDETSRAGMVDEIVNEEEALANDLQFKHDVSSQTEPLNLQDAVFVSEVESDPAKNLIHSSPDQSNEVCDWKEAGDESTHLLSSAKTLPAEGNPEVMIGDFKENIVLKSGAPMDLGDAEEIISAENDKVPVHKNLQHALSNVPAGSIDSSSSNALEGDLEKQGVLTPVGGTIGVSAPENLPSAISSVPAGTLDDLKEDFISLPIDGEVGSIVPDIPIVHSSVPAQNIANSSSKKVPDLLNLQNPFSNAPDGSVDNSSLDALEGDLDKVGVLTPIDGKVGIAVAENLQGALSGIPAVTVDNSSLGALGDELKMEGVSTPIGGEVVGTSVTGNLLNPLLSVPAGTADHVSLDAFKDDLTKEGFSTSISGEVIPSVSDLASADSRASVGILGNSSSEALEDDPKKNVVSTPIERDVSTSVPGNLPSALSSLPPGTVDNSSPDPLEDDLKKEVFSTYGDGEFGASVLENPQSALSSVPVGSVDNTSSEALEDVLVKEGVLTTNDGKAGISFPDNLPSGLSGVPAGTADYCSKDTSKVDLKKEGVSTPIDMEVCSSGFRATGSDVDTHLLSVAGTLPVVENPEAMIGEFKDYKGLKSSFSLDVGAAEDIRSMEDDKKVTVSENPGALTTVPAESIDNSSSDTLEDDLKKEDVSIPIDGEIGASGFMGMSDKDNHLLSVADASPAVKNPEVLIGEFEHYTVLKSSFPLDISATEEIRSAENDKKATVHENPPSALSYDPAGNIDNSSSDALDDDLKREGVSIPIDGEIGASEIRITGDADLGSSALGCHPKTSGSKTNNSEIINNVEGSLLQSADGKSLQNEDSESTAWEQSHAIPIVSSTGEQTLRSTNLCGSENANHGVDKPVIVENRNVQAGDEPFAFITTTLTHVETMPETIEKTILVAGDHSLSLEKSSVEVAEERLGKQAHPSHDSTEKLTNSASLDEARRSNQVNIDVIDLGKLCNSSESPKCSDDIPHASEGLKIGEETEVPRSSSAPAVVSELKYEDPCLSSEKTSEDSSSKDITALPIESQFLIQSSASVKDMKTRDPTVFGPLVSDGEDKVTKPNSSALAVDNSFVSSSRTDSLEGNWGSVSVLSTQSDGTAAVDVEILSSSDTQAAEKLDDAFKKPQGAAAECHPGKSDVFEPPSFMTLVEPGVGVDKNATASGIQMPQGNEQSKSEALQAGWFPSITNVVNESEGRKKNEEIIAKVTNWSTGKQHSPLKNLLNEAHAETKKSPNTKQVPAVNQADETASKNGTAVTTVSSILGSEMPNADTVKKEMEKEWNSPARYPIQIKKEKRKGKPYWVPFVCCTSVHQDL